MTPAGWCAPAARAASAARAAAPWIAAAGLLAVMARLVYGPGVVGYDGLYALVWGQAVARGELPEFELATAPTPHPLAIAAGAVLAPLGNGAPAAASALSFAAFGALGAAAFALGRRFGGPLVGAVLAALLLTREVVVIALLQALVDLPFLALVLAALALAVGRRPAPGGVLPLLGLAGLLRPEAWPLAIAWAAWAGRGGGPRRRARLVGGALAAPVAWMLMDLAVTGDPLHSLTGTRELAERLERPRGLGTAVDFLPAHLADLLGGAAAAGGVGGLVLAALRAPERAVPPLAVLIAGLGSFLVLGVTGLPLLIRYVLVPAAILGLFAAYALGGWAHAGRPLRWIAVAAALAVAVLAQAPAERDAIALLRTQTEERRALERDLRAIVARPSVRARIEACGPLYAPSSRPGPLVAQRLGIPPSAVRSAAFERPARGTFLAPAPGRERLYLLDPREPLSSPRTPRGFVVVARSRAWALSARC